MAAAAAETAAARAEGARVALETELATIKQREKEKVRMIMGAAGVGAFYKACVGPQRATYAQPAVVLMA